MKVVIAKLGFDTHSWGLDNLAYAVERAGHTVVYMGRMNTAEQIVKTAVEEDVDAIFLNFYHLNHFGWTRDVMDELEDYGRGDIDIVLGGIIPKEDRPVLREHGIRIYSRRQPLNEFLNDLSREYDCTGTESHV